ncbi:RNA 2',3'-cyclic phosphodiesterase [Salinimonas marina]|uniref:RNA 2',3'-cyclic phosphodiesterase n=2 Tax=Salinimonas marina TaxID=2785918 RepID=A0A7S9E0D4_9ALTE|nr:RNA 2',3'-cyclic phosphodiesterase [Salinimonas marina]
MRCFVGLDLSPRNKLDLEHWRSVALPGLTSPIPTRTEPGRGTKSSRTTASPSPASTPVPVPAANFHLTLAFLGTVDARQHEALISALETIQLPPIALCLNTTGWWAGPKIVFCAPTQVPDSLSELVRQVKKAARSAGIQTDQRPYQPHVTLVRKAGPELPPPLLAPQLDCRFTRFHLFESFSTASGVTYPIRHSWPLRETLSVRERLRRGLE